MSDMGKRSTLIRVVYVGLCVFCHSSTVNAELSVSSHQVLLLPGSQQCLTVTFKSTRSPHLENTTASTNSSNDASSLNKDRFISVISNNAQSVSIHPERFYIEESLHEQSWNLTITGLSPGNTILVLQQRPRESLIQNVVLHVDVERSHLLTIASSVIGWVYFVSWGLSAHCQVYENWKRKSVVGLNFEYLGLNMIGHSLYGIYNFALYFSHTVQTEYFERNPLNANPVQINDVFFSLHNTLVTLYTVFQCFFYDRGSQKLSGGAICLYTLFAAWMFIAGVLVFVGKILLLDLINHAAMIKLIITLIKYLPQVAMNNRRECTIGWSIGNVLMDFIGGLFSLLQMVILAHNFDDWNSLLTDTTKLGLGGFTIMFDILFMIQHYVLYADNNKELHRRPTRAGRNLIPSVA